MTMNNRNNYYYSNKIYYELTINYLNSKNILFTNEHKLKYIKNINIQINNSNK